MQCENKKGQLENREREFNVGLGSASFISHEFDCLTQYYSIAFIRFICIVSRGDETCK